MNKRSITSIDVGTTKICTTIAETTGNGDAYVVGVGITPSNGLHKVGRQHKRSQRSDQKFGQERRSSPAITRSSQPMGVTGGMWIR